MANDVIHEERRNISEGECPVDLMGELFGARSEGETLVFVLTAKAFLAMCVFPVKKQVVFFERGPKGQLVFVQWSLSKDEMMLATPDYGKTFELIQSRTEEFDNSCAVPTTNITRYIIDVE